MSNVSPRKAKFGIKVKLQVAFGVVAVTTVVAAAVAIMSFSDTERSFARVSSREVPMMTDALRLSVASGEISAAAARFVSARTTDDRRLIAAQIASRSRDLDEIMNRLRVGQSDGGGFSIAEPMAKRLKDNLKALEGVISERTALSDKLDARLDALHKVHTKISDKLTPIVDDSYFDVLPGGDDVEIGIVDDRGKLVADFRVHLVQRVKARIELVAQRRALGDHALERLEIVLQALRHRFGDREAAALALSDAQPVHDLVEVARARGDLRGDQAAVVRSPGRHEARRRGGDFAGSDREAQRVGHHRHFAARYARETALGIGERHDRDRGGHHRRDGDNSECDLQLDLDAELGLARRNVTHGSTSAPRRQSRPPPKKCAPGPMAGPGANACVAPSVLARHLDQLLDRLERAVRLDHGEKHPVEAFVLLRRERHRQAADVELARVLDG